MTRKSVQSAHTVEPAQPRPAFKIDLTPAQAGAGPEVSPLSVNVSELIAYTQDCNRTRLNLTQGRTVEVQETTEQIDRLVRAAAAQIYALATKAMNPPAN
ncbi:MAG TPA: hypothetical protein VK815_06490 [Candidatus Acidoferrales bacterium]|nr:hypothetical protein [Candidatus Acidoferrales bacterium]